MANNGILNGKATDGSYAVRPLNALKVGGRPASGQLWPRGSKS